MRIVEIGECIERVFKYGTPLLECQTFGSRFEKKGWTGSQQGGTTDTDCDEDEENISVGVDVDTVASNGVHGQSVNLGVGLVLGCPPLTSLDP